MDDELIGQSRVRTTRLEVRPGRDYLSGPTLGSRTCDMQSFFRAISDPIVLSSLISGFCALIVGIFGGWQGKTVHIRKRNELGFEREDIIRTFQESIKPIYELIRNGKSCQAGKSPTCIEHISRLTAIETDLVHVKLDVEEIKEGVSWLRTHNGS